MWETLTNLAISRVLLPSEESSKTFSTVTFLDTIILGGMVFLVFSGVTAILRNTALKGLVFVGTAAFLFPLLAFSFKRLILSLIVLFLRVLFLTGLVLGIQGRSVEWFLASLTKAAQHFKQ